MKLISTISAIVALLMSSSVFADNAQLETVTVTGTRTGETNLQQTPIAITAFEESDLDNLNVESLRDIILATPNLKIEENLNQGSIFIRGIGTINVFPGSDPSTTVHRDGVYQGRFLSVFEDFIDVERVEVLRGPQGTLYGRNSIAGTINIISRLPSDKFRAKVTAEYGSFDKQKLAAHVSGPLIDGILQGSFAALKTVRDGYVDNLSPIGTSELSNEDALGYEGKLRWHMTDDAQFIFSLDYLEQDETGSAYKPTFELCVICNTGARMIRDFFKLNVPFDPVTRQESYGGSGKFVWDISDELTFTSITAARQSDYLERIDGDYTEIEGEVADTEEDQNQFTQEFQVNWASDDWKWVAGLFYLHENDRIEIIADFIAAGFVFPVNSRVKTDAYAGYANGTYAVTDVLSTTLGIRYSYEEKDLEDAVNAAAQKEDWRAITPKLGIDYQLSDDLFLYATISRGFKSGGFNSIIGTNPAFDPEFVWSYEFGMKSDFLDDRLRINTTAFYYDYADLQVTTIGTTLFIENAADALIRGVELEMNFTPTQHWRIDAAFTYLDARFLKFVSDGINLRGNRLNSAPEYTANVTGQYFQDLEHGTVTYRLNAYWQDREFFSQFNDRGASQGPYQVFNASVSYETLDENWKIIVYGNNLQNEAYSNVSFDFSLLGQTKRINPPRTFGLKVIYQF